jgi:hypothetical protein
LEIITSGPSVPLFISGRAEVDARLPGCSTPYIEFRLELLRDGVVVQSSEEFKPGIVPEMIYGTGIHAKFIAPFLMRITGLAAGYHIFRVRGYAAPRNTAPNQNTGVIFGANGTVGVGHTLVAWENKV